MADDIDWHAMAEMDPTIKSMLAAGVPMTRANYIDMHYNGEPPAEWNEEAEMGLPPHLQDTKGVGLSEMHAGPVPVHPGPMATPPAPTPAKPMPAGQVIPPAAPEHYVPVPPAKSTVPEAPIPSFHQQSSSRRS